MTKEPPISWDGVSLFTSSARHAVTSVVQAKLSLCQEMFCPSCLSFHFITGNTQSLRSRLAASSENERRPKDAAPSQLRPWKRFGRLRTPHARIAAHRSSRRTISALAGLARSSFNVVQGNYGGLRQGRKSPLKHLAKVPDARNERCWFHIFARKLGYENPNLWGACRDR